MDISQLRKKVYYLDQERRKLQNFLLKPEEMVYGSFYKFYRRCGNPNCHCKHGEKHLAKCLSTNERGKTRLIYVRRKDERWVKKQAENYRKFQDRMSKIRKINAEIFELLKKIRDSKLKGYK